MSPDTQPVRGPSIRFSQVNLSLGGARILEDVSFTVRSGEIHCLIGPNGGGKTSLMRSLLGDMPHSGEILIEWQGTPPIIGYVPQTLDFDRTLPISVGDFMAMISQRRPAFLGTSRKQRALIDAALECVGLAGKRNRRLGDLSGGERQRLLLAQALMPSPALLLLDEPMAALDETATRIVEDILLELAAKGVTLLCVAHDLQQVRRMASTVTCLNRTVRFHGPVDEVLTPERVAEAFGAIVPASTNTAAVEATA